MILESRDTEGLHVLVARELQDFK